MLSGEHIAIIDIGSNAVRLVIYDAIDRSPLKIHTERVICNLGSGLDKTGRLSDGSVEKALNSIGRFANLLKSMKVSNISAVATAAIRDAENGQEFIDAIKKDFDFTVNVIDGDDEARLTALGVFANGLGRNGVIGDYGGGSLELIFVKSGEVQHKVSLPLGSHRLLDLPKRTERVQKINEHLDKIDFLDEYKGQEFCALGGSWRSMAKAHMNMVEHPIKTLDHYKMDGDKAVKFTEQLARQNKTFMEKTIGMNKKRVKDIGVAALAMLELFKRLEPDMLIFSGTGLREGLVVEKLSDKAKQDEPLLLGAKKLVAKNSRFDNLDIFEDLFEWVKPLFAKSSREELRFVRTSCYLSDVSLFEHEEYQADHAFQRILLMPFYHIGHEGRAFLAMVQYLRYKGYFRRNRVHGEDEITKPARKLLNNYIMDSVLKAGFALHMAYLLTGGALSLLKNTSFEVTKDELILHLEDNSGALNADIIDDALGKIAHAMGLEPVVKG